MIGVLELECALITKFVSYGLTSLSRNPFLKFTLGGYCFGIILIMFGRSKMKIALRIIALALLPVLSNRNGSGE